MRVQIFLQFNFLSKIAIKISFPETNMTQITEWKYYYFEPPPLLDAICYTTFLLCPEIMRRAQSIFGKQWLSRHLYFVPLCAQNGDRWHITQAIKAMYGKGSWTGTGGMKMRGEAAILNWRYAQTLSCQLYWQTETITNVIYPYVFHLWLPSAYHLLFFLSLFIFSCLCFGSPPICYNVSTYSNSFLFVPFFVKVFNNYFYNIYE